MSNGQTPAGGDEKIDVSYVAHLARISLSEPEQVLFQEQLEHILEHVKTLDELDVSAVEPMAHATPMENQFREDKPRDTLEQDTALGNAPDSRQGLFFVPKIIE